MGNYVSVPGTSPGTTPEGPVPKARGGLPFDPRSISDDVSRTPIRVSAATDGAKQSNDKDANSTPTAPVNRALHNRMKELSIDPRSPSGIPRTPILLQDEDKDTSDPNKPSSESNQDTAAAPPKRGGMVAPNLRKLSHHVNPNHPPAASKLNFEEDKDNKENDLSTDSMGSESSLLKNSSKTLGPQASQKEGLLLIESQEEEEQAPESPEKFKEVSPIKPRAPLGAIAGDNTLII